MIAKRVIAKRVIQRAGDAVAIAVAIALIATSAIGLGLILGALGGCGFDVGTSNGVDMPDGSVAPFGDAGPDASSSPVDAGPDAARVEMTLRQTSDGVIAPNTGVACSTPGGATKDQAWFRVFRLSVEGIAGPFSITNVGVRVSHATSAQGVQVKIGSYTGAYGQVTLDESAISWLATATIDIADAGGPIGYDVGGANAAVTIPAGGTFVVAVVAPSYTGSGGDLHLGFTTAGERAPSYFRSYGCGETPPATTEQIGVPGHLVLEVSGFLGSPPALLGTEASEASAASGVHRQEGI